MKYYIGVDIGTTATKAVAFSEGGDVLAKESAGYKLHHPQRGYSELHPEEVFSAVITCLKKIAQTLQEGQPVFVSFGSFMHSLVVMDDKNALLTNCITWADNRAAGIAEALNNSAEGQAIYQQTGVPVHAMSPLCKILWLKENDPILFATAAKYTGIKEYIFHRLFNVHVTDKSIASATGLLNIYSLEWEPSILQRCGIAASQLSSLVDNDYCLRLTGLGFNGLESFAQAAFIIGGSDGALSTIGSGADQPGSLAVTIGTSAAVRLLSPEPYINAAQKNFCYSAGDHQYIIGGASNNGAIALQWLQEKILNSKEDIEVLLQGAESIAPACDDLLFLPYILGERAPLWNEKAKGAFAGLSIGHTQAHLVRAVVEGIVYNLYAIAKTITAHQSLKMICASGGFTKSIFWVQLLADVFNLPVFVPDMNESAASGAVITGMASLKLNHSFPAQAGITYLPDAAYNQYLHAGI